MKAISENVINKLTGYATRGAGYAARGGAGIANVTGRAATSKPALLGATLPGRLAYSVGDSAVGRLAIGTGLVASALRARKLRQEKEKESGETPKKEADLAFLRRKKLNENENLPQLPVIPNPDTPPVKSKTTLTSLFQRVRNRLRKPESPDKRINDRMIQVRKLIPNRKPQVGTPKELGKMMA